MDQILMERPALDSIIRPTKDALKAAGTLGTRQARYLVDSFYQIQELRKAASNQAGAMIRATAAGHAQEPHETLDWIIAQMQTMENQLGRAFEFYAMASAPGRWLMGITGIGPVLAANFLARLSVRPWHCVNPAVLVKRKPGEENVLPCPPDEPCTDGCGYREVHTAGGFWKFAGLDPTVKWEEGKLRPWNAAVKVACWKASDSWVKLKNNPASFYSRIYVERKEYEMAKNERGELASQAEEGFSRVGKKTKASTFYRDGKLPPGHIEARARRYAVKMFLSHLHEVMYEDEFGCKPPKPFAIEHLGHAHYIAPPGWPLVE
jgi:hypothetical protein